MLFDNAVNACYEASLSLTHDKLLSWKHIPGVQPTMTIDEQEECEQAVLNSAEFKAKLKEHTGVDDTSLVMVDIWSAGNYGAAEDSNRRLARPLCFLRTDPTDNGYVRPIEGLRPVVDLNTMEVVRVEDYGHWPCRRKRGNYAADRIDRFRTDIKPLEIRRSRRGQASTLMATMLGVVAKVEVRDRLQCARRLDAASSSLQRQWPRTIRTVPCLKLARNGCPLRRSGPQRSHGKNAFDVGEYGMGMCANSLRLGCDCLGLIRYFDAVSVRPAAAVR